MPEHNREPRRIETRAALAEACLEAARAARYQLDVVSRDLDPATMGRPEFVDALRALVLGSRRARLRFLAHDTTTAAKHGHPLVELARRLSSFVEIRQLARNDRESTDAFLIADRRVLIYRSLSERPDAEVADDRLRARELGERFETLWARAEQDPELRRLHL